MYISHHLLRKFDFAAILNIHSLHVYNPSTPVVSSTPDDHKKLTFFTCIINMASLPYPVTTYPEERWHDEDAATITLS